MGKNKKKDITVRIIQTKRRGKTIAIQLPKQRTQYYKDKGQPIEAIIQYAKDRTRQKKKGTYKEYIKAYEGKEAKRSLKTQASRYYKAVSQRPTLHQILRPGTTEHTIQNAQLADENTFKQHYTQHMQNREMTNKLRDILAQENNIQQLRKYITTRISIKNDKGEELTWIETRGQKTPREALQEVMKTLHENGDMDSRITKWLLFKQRYPKQYTIKHQKNGTAARIDLTSMMTKP